jgi:hypothetical protein
MRRYPRIDGLDEVWIKQVEVFYGGFVTDSKRLDQNLGVRQMSVISYFDGFSGVGDHFG